VGGDLLSRKTENFSVLCVLILFFIYAILKTIKNLIFIGENYGKYKN
jgi:hypothetical protein